MSSPLDWFGLPPEADERDIKRAYAKRLKSVRPDTDPVGFQELHEMYRHALAWCAQAAPAPDDEEAATEAESFEAEVMSTEARTPAATPAPPRAWHPVRFTPPPAPAPAPAAPPRFELPAFIDTYMRLATAGNAEQLNAWLHEQPALWSLQIKLQAGRALIQRLLLEAPPIDTASMGATLRFFDLEHTQSGIDPLQLEQLRVTAQQRHALVRRLAPDVHPWGADPERLDLDAFFIWLRAQTLEDDSQMLEATLCVQPALRNLGVRQAAARPLFERLWLERPPMRATSGWLLIQFFGLRPLLAGMRQTPQDFVARLEIAWLMLEQNKNALAIVTKAPKLPHPTPGRARRELYRLCQPFRWWWIICAALVPGLLSSMGRFAQRLCGGNMSLLEGLFDPRLLRFCVASAERFVVTRPRVIVGGLRCLALLLAGVLMSVVAPPPNRGFLDMAGLATAAWLYYLGFLIAWRWQQQPEEPVTPRPLLRLAFVPMLALGALAVYLLSSRTDARPLLFPTQLLAMPAIALGYLRWRARNPGRASFLSKLPDTLVGLLVIGMAGALLSQPLLPVTGALMFWAMDLFKQRKQLRLR